MHDEPPRAAIRAPDASLDVVASVSGQLAAAGEASRAGEYATAFRLLHSVLSRVDSLRVAHPDAAIVDTLQERHARMHETTTRICNEIRTVRIDLGLTPPRCSEEVGGPA
jgi:hypothetical protein